MEFGIAVATTTDSWKVVKRAEELGFTDAWFYDTQLLNPDVRDCGSLFNRYSRCFQPPASVAVPGR